MRAGVRRAGVAGGVVLACALVDAAVALAGPALTPVAGSPFGGAAMPHAVAFSPSGTSVSLSTRTLFAFDSARLTAAAKRLLTKLRPVILSSPRVTIDRYTADGAQTRQQENWSRQLSARRANTVKAFLFAGHVPPGTRLTVTGRGGAHDSAGSARDRRSTIAYQRFTITIDR